MGSLLWTAPRREYILSESGGCQRVALPATERHPLYPLGVQANRRYWHLRGRGFPAVLPRRVAHPPTYRTD